MLTDELHKMREGAARIAADMKSRPVRGTLRVLWRCVAALAIFWWRMLLIAGLCALLFVYAAIAGQVPGETIDFERVKNMCLLMGFAIEFARICFRFVLRLTFSGSGNAG